jgi:DNA excision repair protein ERCC-3
MTDEPGRVVLRRWDLHYYYFINGTLDDRAVRTLNSELSYFVKDYERTDAFKKGTWNGQNTLFYKTKKGVYYFPAGLLPQVTSVLKAYNVPHTIEALDITKHLTKYPDLDLKWYGPKLRDYQVKCVSDIMMRGGGVLSLPTGGGKTLIALKMIQMYDKPCLIVVHRRELMRQWIKEIKDNLHYKAARYAGSEKDRFEYITVGLMQSLIKYKGNLDFPILTADECLPYESRVVTDRGEIPIGEIVENGIDCRVLTHKGRFKRVVGYQKIPKIKTIVRVNHDFGNFICTEDHNILTDHGFVKAGDLTRGDTIYHVQMRDLPERVRNARSPRGAYKIPRPEERRVASADGETARGVEGSYRSHSGSKADDTWESHGGHEPDIPTKPEKLPHEETETCDITLFRAARVRDVEVLHPERHINNRAENIKEHRIVPGGRDDIAILVQNARVHDSDIRLDAPARISCEDDKSIVAGFNYRSNRDSSVVHGRREFIETREVSIYQPPHRGNGGRWNGDDCILDAGQVGYRCYNEKGQAVQTVGGAGVQLCGDKQPRRRATVFESGKTVRSSGKINALQTPGFVYDITVEDDHTFVAEGVVVSNCHHVPANTLYSISMNCNAAVRFGLSATPRREQGDEMKIWAAMGTIASDIRPTDLIKAGYLSKPKFVFLRPPAVNITRKAKWHDLYMDGIQMNMERNAMIIESANEMLDEGLLTYIHVERIDHGEYLAEHIPGASFVCGATPKKMRDNLIDTFASGQRRCLVSTLLGEGVNIPAMESIIMAGGLKTTTGAIQKIGRALRIKPGKEFAIVVDFVDRGPILGRHWEKRYDAYREYYGEYVPDFAIGKGKQTIKKPTIIPGTKEGEA